MRRLVLLDSSVVDVIDRARLRVLDREVKSRSEFIAQAVAHEVGRQASGGVIIAEQGDARFTPEGLLGLGGPISTFRSAEEELAWYVSQEAAEIGEPDGLITVVDEAELSEEGREAMANLRATQASVREESAARREANHG